MDELNEYLECTWGRCDDGICRCSACDVVTTQETDIYEEINYEEYIENLND